jgi:hypothetical protein
MSPSDCSKPHIKKFAEKGEMSYVADMETAALLAAYIAALAALAQAILTAFPVRECPDSQLKKNPK